MTLQQTCVLSDHSIEVAWTAFSNDRGEESFQAFHEACAPVIFSVCVSVLRDQDDAMDAMQLVYVDLLETALDPGGRGSWPTSARLSGAPRGASPTGWQSASSGHRTATLIQCCCQWFRISSGP